MRFLKCFEKKLMVVLTISMVGLVAIAVTSCSKNGSQNQSMSVDNVGNAVYYWKNSFKLSEVERDFLKNNNIRRMYVRFFDVGVDQTKGAVPTSTISFDEELPEGIEIVPTVFITLDALDESRGIETVLAKKIFTRIKAIATATGIPVGEVQIDCDWTKRLESSYYALCVSLKELLHNNGIELSSTIRLHQLEMDVPPVDRGVLMLYNTGNVKEKETKNSILDYDVVKDYLKGDINYQLPMSFAYPIFSWGVVFNEKNYMKPFARLSRVPYDALQDKQNFNHTSDNWYMALFDNYQYSINQGEMVRYEAAEIKEIMKVKKLIYKYWGKTPYANIIYHLDEKEIKRYSSSEITKIYE